MSIAVDAMGGDHAPGEIVKGVVNAVNSGFARVILVGPQELIEADLKNYRYPSEAITVRHADEVIRMDEHPASEVRRKKNSSLVVATRLVKEGEAAAVISAGNTGAQMAAALFEFGRLPGIERPGIATVFPSPKGPKVLIDSGANVDVKASHLVQFACLGSHYARQVLGIGNPRVALLSVGSEATKGTEAVIEAHQTLAAARDLCFAGNIEGREFLTADVDVIACDGFVGNIALKLAEGIVSTLTGMIRDELKRNPLRMLGGMLVKPAFSDLFRKMDYTEYGGAPLLGVNGLSVICHGSSRARAIQNAVRYTAKAVQENLVESLQRGWKQGHEA
ncbi:MAG: phosphate acyltransferase PlsX [Thermacetogeniaceae bacterium]